MLVLYAHGSSDERWLAPFHALLGMAREKSGEGAVALAFAEFAVPSLRETIKSAYKSGERSFTILPLYVAKGAHLAEDLPEELSSLEKELLGTSFEVLPPLGELPGIRDALLAIIAERARPKA